MDVLHYLENQSIQIRKRINLARNCLKVADKGHSVSIQGMFDWLCHQFLSEELNNESKKDILEIICQLFHSLTEKNSDVRLILQTSVLEALIKNFENDEANLQMAVFLNALFDHLSILRCIIRDEAHLLRLTATVLRCYDGLSSEPEYFRLLGRLGFQLQEKNRLTPSLPLLRNFITTVLPPAVDLLLSKSQAVNVTEAKNRWKVVVQNFLFASNFYDDWKNFLHSIPGTTQALPYYPDTIDCVIRGVRSVINDKQKCVFMIEILVDGFLRRYKKSQAEAFIFMAVLLAMLELYPEAKDEPAIVAKDSEAALSLKLEQMPDPETKVVCVLRMLAVLKEKDYSIMTELNAFQFVNWLQNLLQLLMREYGKSVPKVMKVCESLMDINPATIQYVPGPIIKSVLTNRTEVNAQECDSLLTAILQAFVKLRDVPKFLQLLLQAAKLLKVDADFVGKQFLDAFENVVTYELISTQVIGLWGVVLMALEKEMDSGDLELCEPPFLVLHSIIMSGRLVEHTLPDVQFHEIAALTTRTRRVLERAVEKRYLDQNANHGFLKLVFAFNEFHSLLMRYAEVYRKVFEAQHMQVDGEEIRGLVHLPSKTQDTQHPEVWGEIHLQSLRLYGIQHHDQQPIEYPSFFYQFVTLCENSSASHCLKLTKRLIDGAISNTSDWSKLLDVSEVVDARKIQLGVLLNCFFATEKKIPASRWATLCKAVRNNEDLWFSTKDKEVKEKLKELVELVSNSYLEYLDEDSETLKDLSPIFDILLKFPVDSFAHSDMVLLLCYLFASMSSTNDRAALEKAFCLFAVALENPEKVPPLFKYFDANIVIPWIVEKVKGLTESKVVKPVLEVVVDVATRTSGCLEGFGGFSKEEQNDVTRMASVILLENLRKSRKRLKKSPKLNYIDNLLKSVIKSFQKSLKASPNLRPDLENPEKNAALLSASSCILQVHRETKNSTTLKVKTVLNRIPKILQIAYEGIKSDNDNWGDTSRQFIDLVFEYRNDLATKLPGDLVMKVWEAYKASILDERWKDGIVRKICSGVKKTEMARICGDIVEGLKSAASSSNLKSLEKYSCFLRQLIQAQVPQGPRSEIRRDALHSSFSLLSSTQFSWPEGNEAIEASCLVMENFRVLLTSQQTLLSPADIGLGLDQVINAPSEESAALKDFMAIFLASFKILHALLTRHEELSADRMPTLIRCFNILLSAAVSRFHQGKNLGDEDLKMGLVCSEKLGGLASVMADQKLRYRRVAPYVIAEILEQFQKFTLYPAFREQLTHGVYSLMSVLDKHAVSQLLATLPSGSREVFKMEYETFQKYHRYTGKV